MRARISAFAVAAVVLAGTPAVAEQRGYLVSIVGRVIAVNPATGTIVLHHGMLETVNPGVETCVVPRVRLRFFRPGMELSAVADTRHRPWRLEDVHHFAPDSRPPGEGGRRLLAQRRRPAGDAG